MSWRIRMPQERRVLKIVNLLLMLGLLSSLLLSGCQGQLGVNVDLGGGEGNQGVSGLNSEMVLALLLVLLVAVVIIAVIRR